MTYWTQHQYNMKLQVWW